MKLGALAYTLMLAPLSPLSPATSWTTIYKTAELAGTKAVKVDAGGGGGAAYLCWIACFTLTNFLICEILFFKFPTSKVAVVDVVVVLDLLGNPKVDKSTLTTLTTNLSSWLLPAGIVAQVGR